MVGPQLDDKTEIAGISVLDVWRGLRLYPWMAMAIASGSVALCVAIAFLSTPIYRAEVLMVPVGEQSFPGNLGLLARQFGDLAALAGVGGATETDIKREAMALLEARSFTVDFIREEGLMPLLFPESWGQADLDTGAEDVPTYGDAYRLFDKQVRDLHEDSDTGLVTLGIEWRDPGLAAQWANSLVARINARMRERAITESERSAQYLEGELERTTVIGVQQVINGLIETHINRIALAKARPDYAFKIVDPAAIPEPKEYVRPRRLLLTAVGIVMGVFLAVVSTLFRLVFARMRLSATAP